MVSSRAGINFALSLLLVSLPLVAAASSSQMTPYDQEVAERKARFAQEAAQPASPAAILPLLGLGELWDLVDDRAALVALAADAARPRPSVLPTVRAQAQMVLRNLLYHQGDSAAAAAAHRELSTLQAFSIVGPFDNDGRRGHDAVYPPESEATAPTPDKLYEGKNPNLPLHFRQVPATSLARDGSLHLDSWLRPDTQGTAYALCYVKSPRQQPIAVRVGATGAIKVWVNRGAAPAVNSDAYHPLRADQNVGGAVLLPGWNRVLVKISSSDGPWAFVLRLTTPDGQPLSDLLQSASPPASAWPVPRAVPYSGPPPSDILRALSERVRRAPATNPAVRSQALLDLGTYLLFVEPGDPEAHQAEAALAEAAALQPTQRGYRLLAQATSESNQRRQAIEAGLKLSQSADPTERALLLLALGRVYSEGQRQLQAEQAYSEAVAQAPALYTAILGLAEIQAGRGLLGVAEQRVAAELSRHQALRLLRSYADLLLRSGHASEAEAVYRRILLASADDAEALRTLFGRARGRGDATAALDLLARLEQIQPEGVAALRDRVELLEGAGQYEPALTAINAALPQLGGDPDWHERRGRLLLRLGRSDLAVQAYRRALDLRPQNPTLRKYLSHLDPQSRAGEDLARSFRVDVAMLLAQPRPKPAPGDPARVLLDQQVTRVHTNGLSEVYAQRLIEILDERGAREYDEYEVRFTPETQSVEIKAAKVFKQTGEIQEAASEEDSNVSEPWYGLYYDVHAQTVRWSGLHPGDVVYIEYVLADIGRRNLLSDYFGDVHFLQEEIPRLDSRYTLVVPEADLRRKPLYFNQPGAAGIVVARTDRTAADDHLIEFRAQNVPRIIPEPGMPGLAEVVPYVHVSTYRTWEEVAAWYQRLVAEQLQPSPEIARAAHEAVAHIPASDERARLRAIYNLVVKKTRYVGLEFGIHGYKPYKVSQVFQRKFGDCKDKASLLKVMLKEVGIDSTLVLARTRRGGEIASEPASLSIFDHAIVYVPKYDLFLDGTAEFSGSTELPTQDQDISVLIVSDPRGPWSGKGHLARTPVLPAPHSTVSRQLDVHLSADGSARVRDTLHVAGQSAERWREHYQSSGTQKERYEKAWNEAYPGTKALRVELPGIADLERPVLLHGEIEVPSWGRPQGQAASADGHPTTGGSSGELVLRPLGREPDLLRSFARLSQRKYDLVLGFPWVNQEHVVLNLPPGLTARRLPEPRQITSPFGRFDLNVTRSDNQITVKATLRIDRHRIGRDEYAAFRRFCTDVDGAVAQELVVAHD